MLDMQQITMHNVKHERTTTGLKMFEKLFNEVVFEKCNLKTLKQAIVFKTKKFSKFSCKQDCFEDVYVCRMVHGPSLNFTDKEFNSIEAAKDLAIKHCE